MPEDLLKEKSWFSWAVEYWNMDLAYLSEGILGVDNNNLRSGVHLRGVLVPVRVGGIA